MPPWSEIRPNDQDLVAMPLLKELIDMVVRSPRDKGVGSAEEDELTESGRDEVGANRNGADEGTSGEEEAASQGSPAQASGSAG